MIERLFGKIKKWLFLRYEHSIQYNPYKVHLIFEIICSFHNAFGCSLYKDLTDQNRDTDRILVSNDDTNVVAEKEAKQKRGWVGQKVEALQGLKAAGTIPDFDLAALRALACGPYVLRLAIPYYRHAANIKHMRHANHPNSIRTDGIISRHSRNDVNKKAYRVYHRFSEDGDFLKTKSYCTCGVGMRTVCLCAHMCASLYVLWHRLNNKQIPPQHPRHDRNRKSMIDLYYYRNKWEEWRKQTLGSNNNNSNSSNSNSNNSSRKRRRRSSRSNSNSNSNNNSSNNSSNNSNTNNNNNMVDIDINQSNNNNANNIDPNQPINININDGNDGVVDGSDNNQERRGSKRQRDDDDVMDLSKCDDNEVTARRSGRLKKRPRVDFSGLE